MNEQFVLDMLVLNGVSYHKYGHEHFKTDFHRWMHQLQKVKGFKTIEEACHYFDRWGDGLGEQAA
ncbi:hypothetical protein H9635_10190 [Solibacillus sp. A46]|uniref:Uncharacterized protein n=1 Tax=Solibacillus faecavium TaxID=2762221 RepID=A0ABR8XYU6_9BACL|nr:hypothetical protein [Solibacillus faecavium]MBD8037115.1 hypothetical protein [Solibacillus faecavium]